MIFANRQEAGKKLAQLLDEFKNRNDVVVYALPRGGVVTGVEVANALKAPLDLLVPRKVGHPYNPEYALCAISPEGDMVCGDEDRELVKTPEVKKTVEAEKKEATRRIETYLAGRPPISAKGKIAVIVDDGIATGLTMRAAVASVKHRGPREIIVAVPVTPEDSAKKLETEGVRVIAISREESYAGAVGAYYQDFPQVEDAAVLALLRQKETS